jgi:PAS domain S-box-containing protein
MPETGLKQYWNTAIDMIHDGVMLIDTDGHIASANQALSDITGYQQEELIGQPCSILKCDGCVRILDPTKPHWCRLFDVGEVKNLRCGMVRKDGSNVHIIKSATVLKDDEKSIIGSIETMADVTALVEKDDELENYRRVLNNDEHFEGMLGTAPAIQNTFELINNLAASDAPALILGESGTGKELVAQALHNRSRRRDRPFIKVNCSSLNESVLESELFGHVKGAFTGAYQNRQGRFEAAHGGDIFLDEIGDISQSIQVKLLRVLEEKVIERVGDNKSIQVDVRIITATNQDLKALVEQGKFRSDFYYRINVLPIEVPPLRDRPEDIPLLAEMFFRQLQLKSGKPITCICPKVMNMLVNYPWPGNVRQLRGVFEYAFATCNEKQIKPAHLPAEISHGFQQDDESVDAPINSEDDKKEALVEALRLAGGNKSQAARILGVSRVTVWNQMHRFNLC